MSTTEVFFTPNRSRRWEAVTNKATVVRLQVVPGSHLWDDVRTPVDNEVCYATMTPGDVLLVLGSTWHAGGGNVTTDERRPQHTFFFTRGMYRPEVCSHPDILGLTRD